MTFLYHRFPKRMIRPVLVPLAGLRKISLDLYHTELAQYENRAGVLDKIVEPLGCPQRDVIFFSLVHPKELLGAMRRAGVQNLEPLQCFEIPAHLLSPDLTTIRRYNRIEDKIEFHPYDPKALDAYAGIPSWTLEYWRTCTQDRHMQYWRGIPQILYRGTLNITGLPIVEGR